MTRSEPTTERERILQRRDLLKIGAGAAVGASAASGVVSAQDAQGDEETDAQGDESEGAQEGEESDGLFLAAATGDQQTEPVDTEARGGAMFGLTEDGSELEYALLVNGIEDVTMAHIHLAPPDEDGPIAVWLYPGPDAEEPEPREGRFDGVLASDTITEEHLTEDVEAESLDALLEEMEAGDAYVNVHTEANPGGEIRGQIATFDDAASALTDADGGDGADDETDGAETDDGDRGGDRGGDSDGDRGGDRSGDGHGGDGDGDPGSDGNQGDGGDGHGDGGDSGDDTDGGY